jgi:hypothetical protein
VYELTPYGRELEPVLLALGAWGFKATGKSREEHIITADSMTIDRRTAFRPQWPRLCRPPRTRPFGSAELHPNGQILGPGADQQRGHGVAREVGHRPGLGHEAVDADDQVTRRWTRPPDRPTQVSPDAGRKRGTSPTPRADGSR